MTPQSTKVAVVTFSVFSAFSIQEDPFFYVLTFTLAGKITFDSSFLFLSNHISLILIKVKASLKSQESFNSKLESLIKMQSASRNLKLFYKVKSHLNESFLQVPWEFKVFLPKTSHTQCGITTLW